MPPEEVDSLRKMLDGLELKGANTRPFKGLPVMEKAFFPGGNGLFEGSRGKLPIGGTLILGSNFGCVSDFVKEDGNLVRSDETEISKTWIGRKPGYGLNAMLFRTPIILSECFFTNAWPFLHEGRSNDASALIKRWLNDQSLMKECKEIFMATVSKVKPKLIVALGTGSSAFIGKVWKDEFGEWGGCTIASMDRKPIGCVGFEDKVIVYAAITHPSAHDLNAKRRREPYNSLPNSINGEVRLLIEAAERAGIANSTVDLQSAKRSPCT